MSETAPVTYEQQAAAAFNKQSPIFDELYSANTIVHYKRKRVRDHVSQLIKGESRILELNSGTGEDAIYFGKQGHHVHATDISEGMQQQLIKKIKNHRLEDKISYELRSFTELSKMVNRGPYDFIFSNFAGLNCTNELAKVLNSFIPLLKPGGVVTLVILPKFCLWETLLLFKGRFKTAFRRFFSSKGRRAHIEGVYFRCWYHNPSSVKKILKKDFKLLSLEGLCTFVPPSYIENFAEKHPKAFRFLKNREEKLKTSWPWRSIGDYYIISFRING
jgi:ubiquinone/menaquinone biosynthesis C-methylase UbiE